MNSLKSFVKNIAEKAQTDFSPQKSLSDNGQAQDGGGGETAEGFICPSCMTGFTSPERLERHYTIHHATGPGAVGGSLADLKDEIQDLQTTLKEEQWYSAELRKEVERLSNAVQRNRPDDNDTNAKNVDTVTEEKVLIESQVAALEEAKSMLTIEVANLKTSLEDKETNVREFERLAGRLAEISTENADLKAALDEKSGLQAAADEKIKILETVLAERNNTDDVAVLRRELHNVQKLMMSNLPDPDFETNILDENTRLRQEVRDLRDKSASEEVEKLRQELLHAREDGAKFENAEVERLRLELTRLKEEHENSQSDQIEKLRQELSDAKAKVSEVETDSVLQLSNELEKAGTEISNLKMKFEASEIKVAESEEKLTKVQYDYAQSLEAAKKLRSQLESAETERRSTESELSAARLGTEKSQNKISNLEAKLSQMSGELQTTTNNLEDQLRSGDELRSKIVYQEGALVEANRLKSLKDTETAELKKELSNLRQEIDRLDSERSVLLSKIEEGDGVNTALQQLKQQNELLSDQLESLTNEKQTLSANYELNLETLHSGLQEAKSGLTDNAAKLKKSNQVNEELTSKLAALKVETEQLQVDLQAKADQLLATESALTTERRDHETQSKSLQKLLDEKSSAVSKLEQDIVKLKNAVKDESSISGKLKADLDAALEASQQLQARHSESQAQLKLKESEVQKLSKEREVSEREKSDLKSQVATQSKEIQKIKSRIVESEKEANILVTKVSDSGAKIESLEKENLNLSQKLSETVETLSKTRNELSQNEKSRDQMSQNVSQLSQKMSSLEKSLQEQSTELQKSEALFRKAKSELDETAEKLRESEKTTKDFLTTVEENIKTIAFMEDEKNDISAQLESKASMLDALNAELSKIESSLDQKSSELEAVKMELSDRDETICRIQKSSETEKLKNEERISDLERAKDILLDAKVNLQNEVADSGKRQMLLQEQIESVNGQLKDREDRYEMEVNGLRQQIAELSKSHEVDLEQERQKFEALGREVAELQSRILQADKRIVQYESRYSELSSNYDSALSARLELEAKVEAASDERRSLLERCLGAESELERSRSTIVELRRKLDDSQAALHELGRENQSIQVELARQSGRKWADDSEVNNCSGCRSQFTITNRKHHCRNCGKIFCHDCSNKQATMSDYKKPQRVCESCFSELQQQSK